MMAQHKAKVKGVDEKVIEFARHLWCFCQHVRQLSPFLWRVTRERARPFVGLVYSSPDEWGFDSWHPSRHATDREGEALTAAVKAVVGQIEPIPRPRANSSVGRKSLDAFDDDVDRDIASDAVT